MEIVIGVAEMAVTSSAEDTLVTYSLGSCVGLTVYDPVARVGGLLHAMLPVSTLDRGRAAQNPQMFTDTGVAALLTEVFACGARRQDLVATIAGASRQMDPSGLFRIGERNYMVVRKVLWKNGILVSGEDVGGCVSRTMYLEMSTGRTLIKTDGRLRTLGEVQGG